jgi:hypothetical protein
MTAAVLEREQTLSVEMGPWAPPTANEILEQMSGLDKAAKGEVLMALGEAAIGIHQQALDISRAHQQETGEIVPVLLPSSVADGRIAGPHGVYRMAQDRKGAGRSLILAEDNPGMYAITGIRQAPTISLDSTGEPV